LLALLRVRVELVAVELKEEAERRKRIVLLAVLASFFLGAAVIFAGFLVVVLFWDSSYRLSATGAVTLVFFGIGLWAFLRVQAILSESPHAFAETLKEFRKDLEFLRGHDE